MTTIAEGTGRMAFREKTAWVTLATTLVVYGAYFAVAAPRLLSGQAFGFLGPLIAAVVVLVAVQIVGHIVIAATDPQGAREPRDERERLISLRANRAGFYTVQVGAFLAIVSLFWSSDPRLVANAVFLAMAAAEVVRSGSQAIDYRRAA